MEKELNEVTKATPTAAVLELELRLTREKYEHSDKKRVEGARVGGEKAADRVTPSSRRSVSAGSKPGRKSKSQSATRDQLKCFQQEFLSSVSHAYVE